MSTELRIYYARLLNLIQGDVDILLTEPDPAKRAPKMILEYLKMAKTCEEQLQSLESPDDSWDNLPQDTKDKISRLLEEANED